MSEKVGVAFAFARKKCNLHNLYSMIGIAGYDFEESYDSGKPHGY